MEGLEVLSGEELHTPYSFLVLFNGNILGKHRKPQVITMFHTDVYAYAHTYSSIMAVQFLPVTKMTRCDGLSCQKNLQMMFLLYDLCISVLVLCVFLFGDRYLFHSIIFLKS